jgi:HNH endonuclease
MAISERLRQQIALAAGYRCEYCKTSSNITGTPLVIDHIFPRSLGGEDSLENLAAACYRCNLLKGTKTSVRSPNTGEQIPLFNPRLQVWKEHFAWTEDGTMINGLTTVGKVTVTALRLNNESLVLARSLWVSARWHPPVE